MSFVGFLNSIDAATVKGRVLNSRSSAPVEGARVGLVGTTMDSTTGTDGGFAIEHIAVGKYTLRASLVGSGQKTIGITVDSANQTVEVTMLMKVAGEPLVPGCIPEFMKYQSELAEYLAAHPTALSFEISAFNAGDTSVPASVIVSVTNTTPNDVYVLKDGGLLKQMYALKFIDPSSRRVPSLTFLSDAPVEDRLHELSDVVRVPKKETVSVDTVKLWDYDVNRFSSGNYKLQLVYIFPQSHAMKDDLSSGFFSPVASEEGIGELYCMTLRGRYESNWLPIQIK